MPRKLGRPLLGKTRRKVLACSVSAETYKFILQVCRTLPADRRRPGHALDLIVMGYQMPVLSK